MFNGLVVYCVAELEFSAYLNVGLVVFGSVVAFVC